MTTELVERGDRLIVSDAPNYLWKWGVREDRCPWGICSMAWTSQRSMRSRVEAAMARIFGEEDDL